MCGLFGFVSYEGPAQKKTEDARQALSCLTHRGPDQWSDIFRGNVYLGHRRLSIVDLSESGRQPMQDQSERVAITVNGEIYNYPALKQQLPQAHFNSQSDSEIVLHGHLHWGFETMLERIEGSETIETSVLRYYQAQKAAAASTSVA